MSSITPHYRTITELLQSRSFSIDEYQREYKWERTNIEELVTDLQNKFEASYSEGDSPKKAGEYADYFLGSIIVTERNNKSYLVDGQQRVTSLTLLLIHLYREAKERGLSVASTIEPLIFSDDFGEQSFNLAIPERVPVIQALFNGEDYNTDGKEESIRTIVDRFRDIENLDLADDLGAGFETFVYWLLRRVGLIEIATASDVQAYSIFETMNDRGKPLSPVDMLKAYLLAPIDSSDGRSNANRVWKHTVLDLIAWEPDPDAERDSACIKAWLRAQYADGTRDRRAGATDKDWELIGSAFHRWLRDNEKRVGAGGAQQNLRIMTEEFPFFARAYRMILEASRTYTPGLRSVFYNAHNDFTWQTTVLLAPLCAEDDDETVRRKIEAVAAYLDIWIMRRTVNYIRVGYSTVSYAMWLLCRDIRRKPLDELIDILSEKLRTDDVTFEGSASKGRIGIADLRLNQFSRRYIYHLLARITAYVETGAGQADQFDSYVNRSQKNPYDIEHVRSDSYDRDGAEFESEQDFDAWRNDVSGLVLLRADVNRSLQDKCFADKAPHYAKQNVYAASFTASAYEHQPQFAKFRDVEELPFRSFEEFGKAEQEERSALVLALANKIWSPARLEELRP
ncbi:DUF262 domain-containing protein [Rhodococcus spongiicola]|uniref:DUF262 domain-containing protein n=1 Tax=Rhodococcus spongiicola TaxID=2487352 RepID=A0A438AX01_9NOCA|nr:DUF262 domain-containing protein [Rhodococcus spongiicola]RVW03219.1 DUF262 domain-containing protein [Rhodococcus spongiicola]